jgi:hypothetical protein
MLQRGEFSVKVGLQGAGFASPPRVMRITVYVYTTS